jgi:hypothetical protein
MNALRFIRLDRIGRGEGASFSLQLGEKVVRRLAQMGHREDGLTEENSTA